MPVSSDARSAEIGSAKMPVELILARTRSSEALSRPDGAASAESRFYQIYESATSQDRPSRRRVEDSGHPDESCCPEPQVRLGSALGSLGVIERT
jgi:hypothetical protein